MSSTYILKISQEKYKVKKKVIKIKKIYMYVKQAENYHQLISISNNFNSFSFN